MMKLEIKMKTSLVKLFFAGLVLWAGRFPLGAQPVITNQPVNQTVIYGGNATFSVLATGAGPLTYQWQLNGTNLPNNIITTVAGGNLFNNQPSTNTILASAAGTAMDTNGNLYIADTGNNVIRKVGTNGIATIIAGNGIGSFSGDGGAATNASLTGPSAVILDSVGNLLIADSGNCRIRKVGTNGIITTMAGKGIPFYSGDNGAATNAAINNPVGLTLDTNGNLFIADSQNNRVRKVAVNGTITTVAGNGTAGFNADNIPATGSELNYPTGVAVDVTNNLFIADYSNQRIRKVNALGTISTVAGTGSSGYSGDGGSPTSAKINSPSGVVLDAAHNLFIVDYGNQCIRKVGTNGIITTVAGTGTNGFSGDGGSATNANLSSPQGLAVDGTGNYYIADSGNNRVRKVGTNGIIATVAGRALNDGDFATNATLNVVYGAACDVRGNLYIADTSNNRIRKVDTNGVITTFAGNGFPAYSGDGGAATNASLKQPTAIVLDALGNAFIAERGNYRIRKVDTNGNITTVVGNGTYGYAGDGGLAVNANIAWVFSVAVDATGNLYLADNNFNRIRRVDTNGYITTVAGTRSFGFSGDGGAATNAKIAYPRGVTLDPAGNLYIADYFNYRIRKVDTNGNISTVAGIGSYGYSGDGGAATNASINNPTMVTADSAGNIYIADAYNQVIRKVNTNGIISTIAGNGVVGFAGDGGMGNNASMADPNGVAVDGVGNVYISDTGNNRIRKLTYVDYADQPFFTATNVTPANATNQYSVIITSASGSVTSSVVTLAVQLPPVTPAFTASNGVCQFTWSAVSNLTYQLQVSTNLTAPNWQDLGSPVTATNNTVSASDAVGADGQRFYRVRSVP